MNNNEHSWIVIDHLICELFEFMPVMNNQRSWTRLAGHEFHKCLICCSEILMNNSPGSWMFINYLVYEIFEFMASYALALVPELSEFMAVHE